MKPDLTLILEEKQSLTSPVARKALLTDLQKANVEQNIVMKERNKLTKVMVDMASQKHQMEREKHRIAHELELSRIFDVHLSQMEAARSSLKEMRNSTGYDSDSPEARLAKVRLCVFTAKYEQALTAIVRILGTCNSCRRN